MYVFPHARPSKQKAALYLQLIHGNIHKYKILQHMMKEPFDKPDWWPNICVEVGVSAVNQPAGVFCVVHGSYYPGFDLRFAVLKVTSER